MATRAFPAPKMTTLLRKSKATFFLFVLQTVGFGDNLFFRRLPKSASEDIFDCNMDGVPTDGSNLVLRALDLFREKTSTQDFFEVWCCFLACCVVQYFKRLRIL